MRGWVLKLAFRYLFPQRRWGTFFTWMSIVGIMSGVALLVIVLSIMNGFDENIAQKLIQINGPIKILSTKPILQDEILLKRIRSIPYVKAVTPFVQGVALIQCGSRVAFPKCLGLDSQTVQAVLPLKRFIKRGNLHDLQQGAFITSAFAQELGLKIGDTFDLYSPLSLEAIKKDELILPQEVTVCGIFKTGWAEVDRDTVLFPLPMLQEIYGLGDQVHGFSVNADQRYLSTVCCALNAQLPTGVRAYIWNELNEDFLYILKMEKMMCFFVLLFVVAVAAFSMSSGLISAVVRKQREIVLLRIWGASRFEIAFLFSFQSLLLSFLGTLCGFAMAYFILYYRNGIVNGLTGWFLPQNVLWKFYDVETLPVSYCAYDFVLIAIFTFSMTLLASLLPIIRALQVPLIKGLRNE